MEEPPVLIGTAFYREGFENGMGGWEATGSAGPVTWRRLQGSYCSGSWVMLLGAEGRAPFQDAQGACTLTLTIPIDLAGHARPHLGFDMLGTANPADSLIVQPEARRPGGDWRAVGAPAFAEVRGAVAHRYADLTAFAGGLVELRFRATVTPAIAPGDGLLLDEVKVLDPTNL